MIMKRLVIVFALFLIACFSSCGNCAKTCDVENDSTAVDTTIVDTVNVDSVVVDSTVVDTL